MGDLEYTEERNLLVNWHYYQQRVIVTILCLHFTYIYAELILEVAKFQIVHTYSNFFHDGRFLVII